VESVDNNASDAPLPSAPSDDTPDLSIVSHTDPGFTFSNRKIMVFGVPVYALPEVEDDKLVHAANITAQYLDNDEDGSIDDPLVGRMLVQNKASVLIWKTSQQLEEIFQPERDTTLMTSKDLGADETIPMWHINGHTGAFDAALEEILHLLHNFGYAAAYPEAFSNEFSGSLLTDAMDIARGGRFTEVPSSYPANAWYTFDDVTCDYGCMADEYFYWALTSVLGAQASRDVSEEWDLNTREMVEVLDPSVFSLVTDLRYKLPTVLPDGSYRR